ncbi:MAG: hypothetical protein ABI520_16170 [Caldimonas sp.]
MNESSPSPETGRTRRLIVSVLIGTAAATVAAGVAFNERHRGEAVVERAEASFALAGAGAAPAVPVLTRREQWRNPWKRPASLSESASTSVGDPLDATTAPLDPSLPSAAEALKGAPGSSGEDTPTF